MVGGVDACFRPFSSRCDKIRRRAHSHLHADSESDGRLKWFGVAHSPSNCDGILWTIGIIPRFSFKDRSVVGLETISSVP